MGVVLALLTNGAEAAAKRPNILWITLEDISANLGAYGDTYASTPHMDQLARQSVRYDQAYAPSGVCAPARASLILGQYATQVGAHNMRTQVALPESVKLFPELLRAAGYHTSNNDKEDYNFSNTPEQAWVDSSKKAHWRDRKPGQPFFSVFNFSSSHEYRIRVSEKDYRNYVSILEPHQLHDPEQARIPPYHPDTPEVRRDWARYADMISVTDKLIDDVLQELHADGLDDDTIVFLFSDHGAGMPRSKRTIHRSGTHVPLLIRFGKNFRHLAPTRAGQATDRIVNFVDFGPTVLSLAGIAPPSALQGQAFLGSFETVPRAQTFSFRQRMDERYDMQRAVTGHRFHYIRNYMPHRIGAQYIDYLFEMPTMRVWQELFDAGKLRGPQRAFFLRKPTEELYDTWADPHEIHNLAKDPAYKPELHRMRTAMDSWMVRTRDLGLIPEAEMHTRAQGRTPYDLALENSRYDVEAALAAANLASQGNPRNVNRLQRLLRSPDSVVRYWGATGLAILGRSARPARAALMRASRDTSANTRIAAAEALLAIGGTRRALAVLRASAQSVDVWERLAAANVLDLAGDKARPLLKILRGVVSKESEYSYAKPIWTRVIAQLEAP